LNYILVLCEYLNELAKNRFNPFHNQQQQQINKFSNKEKSFDQFTVADVSFKRAEQLLIYLKCLQLLKPMLSYAKDKLHARHLKSTTKVRKIMKQLNNMYKFCLYQSKQLCSNETVRNKWNTENISLNADRLLYNHAIELCKEAAMEEFFGKPYKVI
jgi:serine/threonine-protein kinase ULK2